MIACPHGGVANGRDRRGQEEVNDIGAIIDDFHRARYDQKPLVPVQVALLQPQKRRKHQGHSVRARVCKILTVFAKVLTSMGCKVQAICTE